MADVDEKKKPRPAALAKEARDNGPKPGFAASAPTPVVKRRPIDLIQETQKQLQQMTGYPVDSVSEFRKMEDGWRLTVTVVELERIPAATDVLAEYVAVLDGDGDIVDYRRGRRYYRDQVGEPE